MSAGAAKKVQATVLSTLAFAYKTRQVMMRLKPHMDFIRESL